MMLDRLLSFWPVILGGIALVVWLVRLEGRVNSVEKTQDSQGKQMDRTADRVNLIETGLQKEISEVKQSLSRIEGYLKGIQSSTKLE